jgi:hypothetical protein
MITARSVSIFCACALLAGGCASTGPNREFDLGCIASRDQTVRGQSRTRALGPFYERRSDDAGRTFTAVRPFYSRLDEPERDHRSTEILWPLGVARRFRNESYWRFANVYHEEFDVTDPDPRYRTVAFPLVFFGKDRHKEGYFAVFPLGGTIHEYLGLDRMDFALFPLYGHAEYKDSESYAALWPLLTWTDGEEVSRFRVFPFYGRSRNRGRWEKRFYLWPFYTSADFYYPKSSGHSFILFPLLGRVDLTDQQGWMFLPPLFQWSRSEETTKLNCPWPLFQYQSGSTEKLYVWPLYGRREQGHVKSSFYLWPIVNNQVSEADDVTKHRFHIAPVYYQEDWRLKESGESRTRARKVWPLFCYSRVQDQSLLRVLDLWPYYNVGGVDRNLAPLWTLYSRAQSGDTVEHELLWGLYRTRNDGRGNGNMSIFPLYSSRKSREGAGFREWSLLHGLLGYRREGWQTTYRFLYFLRFRHEADRQASPDEKEHESLPRGDRVQ